MQTILDDLDTAMDGLAGGQLSIDDWQRQVALSLLVGHTAAFLDAAGLTKLADATDADRAALAAIVGKQIDYLNGFADDLEAADVRGTPGQRARLTLYVGSMKAAASYGEHRGVALPAQPGDGSTQCHGNCGCSWVERDDGWHWVRGKTDSCDDCSARAKDWTPWQP